MSAPNNPMKIIVAIKQVRRAIRNCGSTSSGKLDRGSAISAFEINEPDAYALEEALQLKEKHGGEVVALCAGPAARRADHPRSAGQRR